MSDHLQPITGMAAGVPFVALPPATAASGAETAPLIVAWHLNAPPRSAAAMAAALPLHRVGAWRVYLDLPMHGRRRLPGDVEEFMALAYEDAVLKVFEPQVSQAVAELPAVLAALRDRLRIDDGPIGVVGASIGALPAQHVIVERVVPVSAAALISPVIQLAEVVAVNERQFGLSYTWSEASRQVAERNDFVARASEIAAADPQPAVLLVTGDEDDPAFPRQTQLLHAELAQLYRDPQRLKVREVAGMGHAFADEPGVEAAAQTTEARRVDDIVSDWFLRHGRVSQTPCAPPPPLPIYTGSAALMRQ